MSGTSSPNQLVVNVFGPPSSVGSLNSPLLPPGSPLASHQRYDPKTFKYLQSHKIFSLFEKLLLSLVEKRPEDPSIFLVDQLRNITPSYQEEEEIDLALHTQKVLQTIKTRLANYGLSPTPSFFTLFATPSSSYLGANKEFVREIIGNLARASGDQPSSDLEGGILVHGYESFEPNGSEIRVNEEGAVEGESRGTLDRANDAVASDGGAERSSDVAARLNDTGSNDADDSEIVAATLRGTSDFERMESKSRLSPDLFGDDKRGGRRGKFTKQTSFSDSMSRTSSWDLEKLEAEEAEDVGEENPRERRARRRALNRKSSQLSITVNGSNTNSLSVTSPSSKSELEAGMPRSPSKALSQLRMGNASNANLAGGMTAASLSHSDSGGSGGGSGILKSSMRQSFDKAPAEVKSDGSSTGAGSGAGAGSTSGTSAGSSPGAVTFKTEVVPEVPPPPPKPKFDSNTLSKIPYQPEKLPQLTQPKRIQQSDYEQQILEFQELQKHQQSAHPPPQYQFIHLQQLLQQRKQHQLQVQNQPSQQQADQHSPRQEHSHDLLHNQQHGQQHNQQLTSLSPAQHEQHNQQQNNLRHSQQMRSSQPSSQQQSNLRQSQQNNLRNSQQNIQNSVQNPSNNPQTQQGIRTSLQQPNLRHSQQQNQQQAQQQNQHQSPSHSGQQKFQQDFHGSPRQHTHSSPRVNNHQFAPQAGSQFSVPTTNLIYSPLNANQQTSNTLHFPQLVPANENTSNYSSQDHSNTTQLPAIYDSSNYSPQNSARSHQSFKPTQFPSLQRNPPTGSQPLPSHELQQTQSQPTSNRKALTRVNTPYYLNQNQQDGDSAHDDPHDDHDTHSNHSSTNLYDEPLQFSRRPPPRGLLSASQESHNFSHGSPRTEISSIPDYISDTLPQGYKRASWGPSVENYDEQKQQLDLMLGQLEARSINDAIIAGESPSLFYMHNNAPKTPHFRGVHVHTTTRPRSPRSRKKHSTTTLLSGIQINAHTQCNHAHATRSHHSDKKLPRAQSR